MRRRRDEDYMPVGRGRELPDELMPLMPRAAAIAGLGTGVDSVLRATGAQAASVAVIAALTRIFIMFWRGFDIFISRPLCDYVTIWIAESF